jgi:hypothetical protein
MTTEEVQQLKPGDRLIFVRGGSGVNYRRGNVFTFSNFYESVFDGCHYCQFAELHAEGNHVHNMQIEGYLELFDPSVHVGYRIMDGKEIQKDLDNFHEKFG